MSAERVKVILHESWYPRELTDLHLTDPTRAAELRARLEAWEGTFAPAEVTEAPELDEEIRRRLRDLGYIED